MKTIAFALSILLLRLPLAIPPQEPTYTIKISTPEEFKTAFSSVPCKNEERLAAVKALFLEMGATEEDITIEKHKDVENIVIRKQGETEEKIIIGAHYDFIGSGSCGAIDNWTGIVTIAHLYRSLKNTKLKKTLLFVGFGKEEHGLVGSRAMVKQIKKEDQKQYCAMVNIDSLGLNNPQVLKNATTPKLEKAVTELAQKMKLQFQAFEMATASADSLPFLEKNIPAVTISAISNDWMEVFHSKNDQINKINPLSVYLGYRLVLALVVQIQDQECGSYR